jgi:hypothetical protein
VAFEELLGHGEEHFPVRDDDREADRLYAGLPDPARRASAAWTRHSSAVAPGCDRDEAPPRGGRPAYRWSANPLLVLTNSAKPTKKRAKENNEK